MTEPSNGGVSDPIGDIGTYLETLVKRRPSLWTMSACGVTRSGAQIPALIDADAYIPTSTRARVLLISGLSLTYCTSWPASLLANFKSTSPMNCAQRKQYVQ